MALSVFSSSATSVGDLGHPRGLVGCVRGGAANAAAEATPAVGGQGDRLGASPDRARVSAGPNAGQPDGPVGNG